MKIYGPDAIRNVAVVGHGASGKTTLVDALAFVSGASRRHGSIKEGSTLTDTSPDEIDRKHSISLGVGIAEWMNVKINLLDTPGYLDFFGEVVCGLSVADAAVVVLSGVSGVEVGTEKCWNACDHYHLPRILFVSGMDKENANFERAFSAVRERLTPKVLPVEIPVGDGPQFRGIINLLTQTCQLFKPGSKAGEYEDVPVPPEYQEAFARYAEQLTEAVAATDDELLEKYLAGESIPREQVVPAIKKAMLAGEIVPLFCGSGELQHGVRPLLTELVELLPAPSELKPPVDAPMVGRVFKTVSEPHVGDVSIFRIYTGKIKNGDEVWNAEHSVAEKLNHLSVQQGRERQEVAEIVNSPRWWRIQLVNATVSSNFCAGVW